MDSRGYILCLAFIYLIGFFFPCVECADHDCSYMLRNESQEFILV